MQVVRSAGFGAASRELHIAKSAVSRRVRELEDRLGARLVERSTLGIKLTDAGALFYERTVRLLEDLEAAESLVSSRKGQAVGVLRLSAPVSLAVHCMAPVLPEFVAQHPELRVEVQANDELVDVVGEGFDLALRISRLRDSALIQRKLAPIRHVCCASPAYLDAYGRPSKPADVARHRGIAYSNVEARRYWTFRGGESVEPRSRLILDNGDAIREAAIAGGGLVMLPTFIVHRAIERGELEVVLRDWMREPIWLYAVHASNRNMPFKVRAFVDFAIHRFTGDPFWEASVERPP